jgi:hypothetical protein
LPELIGHLTAQYPVIHIGCIERGALSGHRYGAPPLHAPARVRQVGDRKAETVGQFVDAGEIQGCLAVFKL